jgi:hypothetical protein
VNNRRLGSEASLLSHAIYFVKMANELSGNGRGGRGGAVRKKCGGHDVDFGR